MEQPPSNKARHTLHKGLYACMPVPLRRKDKKSIVDVKMFLGVDGRRTAVTIIATRMIIVVSDAFWV